jgi:hypothetical protein
MHNPNITHVPVTVFLGAGATSPLGKPLMADFITQLLNDTSYGPNKLFQQIIGVNPDLEFLFQELEDWMQKGYVEDLSPIVNDSTGGGITRPRRATPWVSSKIIARHASVLITELRKRVFEAYKDVNEPAKVASLFIPLFDGIFSQLDAQKFPLVVFTTNYDPAVEVFCQYCSDSYELEDGFSMDPKLGASRWNRENFQSFAIHGKKKTIVLFKLHGSARWVRKGEDVVKLPFPIYAEAGLDYQNVLIYPATRKVAMADPFFTAYDYFQRTMDSCGCCVVIGYSFRDYDALTKLVSASILNPRLKLVVVDPYAKERCRDLLERAIRCTPAPQRFGQDGEYLHLVAQHVADSLRSQPTIKGHTAA